MILWLIHQLGALPPAVDNAASMAPFLPRVRLACNIVRAGVGDAVFRRFDDTVKYYIRHWGSNHGLVRDGGWNLDVVNRWFAGPVQVECWLRHMGRWDPWDRELVDSASRGGTKNNDTAPGAINGLLHGMAALQLEQGGGGMQRYVGCPVSLFSCNTALTWR